MEDELLNVSDGTGEAVLANITADRAISAVSLEVDSVENFPQKFIAATGTKNVNNFIDPTTMTVFYGHLDGGNIVIDGFAPGYSDEGNTSGQVVVIKPTTFWADRIANKVNDTATGITTQNEEVFVDFIVNGTGVVAQSSGLIGTFSDITYYINGLRLTAEDIADKTYTASKDTYVIIDDEGTVSYSEVANNAAPPALPADSVFVAKVVTDGSAITGVTLLTRGAVGVNNLADDGAKTLTKEVAGTTPSASTSYQDASGDMVLGPGTWLLIGNFRFNCSTASARVLDAKIRNITDGTDIASASSLVLNATSNNEGTFPAFAVVTIPAGASKTYRLQVKLTATSGSNIMGARNFIAVRMAGTF